MDERRRRFPNAEVRTLLADPAGQVRGIG